MQRLNTKSQLGDSIDDYEILGVLGKGGFATVYKARSKQMPQKCVAIKTIDKHLIQRYGLASRVRQEVEIHSRLKHPFVVELYTFFQDDNYVYLVMELAENGELKRYMKEVMHRTMNEYEAACILRQVVSGVLYLHCHHIMHRDISLSNLLLSKDMNVKIADFGLAAEIKRGNENHVTICGTPNFISPEVVSRSSHGLAADVWALGCILYTLLVGKPPFEANAVQATLTNVVKSDFELPRNLSAEACDLIKKLLKKNPDDRMELGQILQHPFLKRYEANENHKPPYERQNASADDFISTYNRNNHSYMKNWNCVNNSLASSSPRSFAQNSLNSFDYKSSDSGILTFSDRTNGNSYGFPSLVSQFSTSSKHFHECSNRPNVNQNRTLKDLKIPFRENQSENRMPLHQSIEGLRTKFSNLNYEDNSKVRRNPLTSSMPSPYECRQSKGSFASFKGLDSQKRFCVEPISSTIEQQSMDRKLQKNAASEKEKHLTIPPLNTTRLQPTRFRTKAAIMSILRNGEVAIEFLKFRPKLNEDRITSICWISGDGQRVIIYEPPSECGLPISNDSPEWSTTFQNSLKLHQNPSSPLIKSYSYEDLPHKYWRKYLFGSRFVDLVKSLTPKVTYYSKQAKFHLMESMKDYETLFYDGSKITQSERDCALKVYDCHGRQLLSEEYTNRETQALIKHHDECLKHCLKISETMEHLQGQHHQSNENICCFPLIIGHRPKDQRIGIQK